MPETHCQRGSPSAARGKTPCENLVLRAVVPSSPPAFPRAPDGDGNTAARGGALTLGYRSSSATTRRNRKVLALAALLVGLALPVRGFARKTSLARRYRAGQTIVYRTRIEVHTKIRSTPPGLEAFLPPLPTELTTEQQTTVTVKAVRPDGGADVEARLDRFELQSNLLERVPEKLRESTRRAQEDFVRKITGQTLTAHYDAEGKLAGVEGEDGILALLDAPLREPVREGLQFCLQQLGGSLSPGHEVKGNEEWKRPIVYRPVGPFPFAASGETTLRYSGKTSYHGIKAATVDSRFADTLTPQSDAGNSAAPAPLQAGGVKLDLRLDGDGSGRALVALDDGHVLESHTKLSELLRVHLQGSPSASTATSGPISLEIETVIGLEQEQVEP